jgi:hypothetical protein
VDQLRFSLKTLLALTALNLRLITTRTIAA